MMALLGPSLTSALDRQHAHSRLRAPLPLRLKGGTDIKWTPGDDKPNGARDVDCCPTRRKYDDIMNTYLACADAVLYAILRTDAPNMHAQLAAAAPFSKRARDAQARAEGRDPDAPPPEGWSLVTLFTGLANAISQYPREAATLFAAAMAGCSMMRLRNKIRQGRRSPALLCCALSLRAACFLKYSAWGIEATCCRRATSNSVDAFVQTGQYPSEAKGHT